ncbi:hypothetical protein JHD47_02780 [Sulfurimonas sp. SAG-AH-194-L11]|nr:hypothetical protein [Sulfurimonas sp. SAG-AH-194-L11]MDF1876737.1 hypothetical protein [Sulfurimonas sp. SAG-AH-194-L11]
MKIKNSIKMIALSVVASTLFVGCGGGDDATTTPTTALTGTFVDAPVQGLGFKTVTQSGFTDASGQFTYIAGEEIEFTLGNLSLGKGTAGTLVTPYSISDTNDTATNIALLLQNFDGNRSNSAVLDLSKLQDFNFSASDFNLSTTPTVIKGHIDILFADNTFSAYRDDTNNTVLDETGVKLVMDNYIDTNSINYDKKFTQAYLNSVDFYRIDIPEQGGNYRLRFRDNQRQIVGDYSVDGWNATFDNPADFYTVPFEIVDGKIIMTFIIDGSSLKVSTVITSISEGSITTIGTALESTVSSIPVGTTKTEIWYTTRAAAEAALQN